MMVTNHKGATCPSQTGARKLTGGGRGHPCAPDCTVRAEISPVWEEHGSLRQNKECSLTMQWELRPDVRVSRSLHQVLLTRSASTWAPKMLFSRRFARTSRWVKHFRWMMSASRPSASVWITADVHNTRLLRRWAVDWCESQILNSWCWRDRVSYAPQRITC